MGEAVFYLLVSAVYVLCGAAIPFSVALAEAHLIKKSLIKMIVYSLVAAICIWVFVFALGFDNKTSTGIAPDWYFRRNSTYFLVAFGIQAFAALAVFLGSSTKDIKQFWFRVSFNALLISVALLCLPSVRAMLLYSISHEDLIPDGIIESQRTISSMGINFDLGYALKHRKGNSYSSGMGLDGFLHGSYTANPASTNTPNIVMYYVSQENLRTSWGRSMKRAGFEVKYVPEMIAVRGNEMIIISGFNRSSGSARFGVVEIWRDADPLFIKQVLKSINYRWYMEKPGYTNESKAPASRSSLQLGKADA